MKFIVMLFFEDLSFILFDKKRTRVGVFRGIIINFVSPRRWQGLSVPLSDDILF